MLCIETLQLGGSNMKKLSITVVLGALQPVSHNRRHSIFSARFPSSATG